MKLLRFSICAFGSKLKSQLILLFSLFLLLFMDPTALFGTIHGFYYTISTDFYLYLLYFQQKVFNFNKISEFQTNLTCCGIYASQRYFQVEFRISSKLYNQNYFERILQIPVCVADKLIRPHSKSGAYLVEKG